MHSFLFWRKHYFFYVLFFIFLSPLAAQQNKIDSLSAALKTARADTNKINIMMHLGNQYQNQNPDTSVYFHTQCVLLSQELNVPYKKCKAMVMLGMDYLTTGEMDKAQNLFNETLILAKEIKAHQVEAMVYMYLASIYKNKADFSRAIEYHTKSIAVFKKLDVKKGVLANLGNMGTIYKAQSNFPKALECYKAVLKVQEESDDKSQMGVTYGNMGNVYKAQGNFSKAIDYYFKALRSDEEFKNEQGVARHLGNIGGVYSTQGDDTKALEYFQRSLTMLEKLGIKSNIASNLGNIGLVYFGRKDYATALDYYERALKINTELGDRQEMLINLTNLGNVYEQLGNADKAFATQLEVIKVAEQLDLKTVLAGALANVGAHYFRDKRYSLAEVHLKKAMKVSTEIGALKEVMDLNKMLHEVYLGMNKYKEAMFYFKDYILWRDSIINKENTKKQVELEMQYAFDKKNALAKAEQAKKDVINKDALDKQRLQRNAFIIGFALMLALAAVIYRSFRNKSKANAIISKQKEEVEMQREISEKQKALVQQKNKEILDSITYAKRLQLAILPPEKFVKETLPESFILYKPKDIVAGDFYWFEKINDLILFAAADCTGHGVPGAMVSVVCSNAMNRAVKEFGIREPGKILDKVRELVVETFEKSESEVKDGMDIALCALQKTSAGFTLQYAGANNPLWITRKNINENKYELVEVRPDKQPIGKHPESKDFTNHILHLHSGDSIYIFTDGYSDQFGGDFGKKLKSAAYKQLLLSIQDKNMQEQKEQIDQYFEKWRGKLEQVDDVCVIGVKV